MRSSLCKKKLNRLLLAALTAGTLTVPAVSAQSGTSTTAKKPAHKSSSNTTSSHASTSQPSTAHKGTTHSSTTHSTSTSSATNKSTKSASSKRKTRTKKVKGQAAPTPERINEIQEALTKKGTFTGTPTGAWDDSTVDAMKKFQSANGLNPSGKLDALTLQKLGLGSETAGVAAPTPPPNSANRLINTSSLPETNNSN